MRPPTVQFSAQSALKELIKDPKEPLLVPTVPRGITLGVRA